MHKYFKIAGVVGALVAASALNAATTSTTFPVTARVLPNCLVAADPLAFGDYTPTAGDLDAAGQVRVRCSVGTAFSVALNAGGTVGATVTNRLMLSGANQLSYSLFTDAARTANWGNTVGTMPTGTGGGFASGAAVLFPVYGRIVDSVANQSMPAGNFTDTVTVTVNY
jgi:spore coat protein U-like protein